MKAITYTKYGQPDVLKLSEVDKPAPEDNEVLVKVHAASINSWDWDMLRGARIISRTTGVLKPKNSILGTDVAGTVEAVGKEVKTWKPGDEVFGEVSKKHLSIGWGGLAEYVCVREGNLFAKPTGMTFEEASAIPQVGALALKGIRYNGGIQPGQKFLMNGAGGGVGTFAVQIAKSLGAEVTAVDRTGKQEMLRSIGADHVIDYTTEDFANNGQLYDLIIDVAASRSTKHYAASLSPGGAYGVIGGSMARFFQTEIFGARIGKREGKKLGTVVPQVNEGLDYIVELFEAGKLKPVIDRTYPLAETADAFRYFGTGDVKGKIVIAIVPSEN